MEFIPLTAISPLDGRYHDKLTELNDKVSEYGLIYYRLMVEIHWLLTLMRQPDIKETTPCEETKAFLLSLLENFSLEDAQHIKQLENITNHDVKAVEYFLREKLSLQQQFKSLLPFIHFACTSEDINNLAYALMLADVSQQHIVPWLKKIQNDLIEKAQRYAEVAMLSRTHGQPASPTTLGKEIANFVARLQNQLKQLENIKIRGKMNGAVGNFNAHMCAYPEVDWPTVCKQFVHELGLSWNPYTTQIEPHDYVANYLHQLVTINNILIDLSRDCWSYISINYLKQKSISTETGSSTMPHKVNPIDFENAEGNLGLANALANHLANKLPHSRWQRDLTDSTTLRNLGAIAGYSLLAYKALLKGLSKITANTSTIENDLNQHWEVLGEAIQTVMRRYGYIDAYEQLKEFTRGKAITKQSMHEFIIQLRIPDNAKKQLLALTPTQYIGQAVLLAQKIGNNKSK